MSKEEILNITNDFNLIEVGCSYDTDGVKYFKRNRYIDYRTIDVFLKETNHYGSFCTCYRYCSNDIDGCLIYGDLYFDFDNELDFEKVRKDVRTVIAFLETVFTLKEDSFSIYYSGNKGMHLTVPAEVLGVQPSVELNHIYKYIVSVANNYTANKTIDTQIYDRKRLFRINNTMHEKSKLYKVQLTMDEFKNLSLQEIKEIAKNPRKEIHINKSLNPMAKKRFERFIEDYHLSVKELELNNNQSSQKRLSIVPPCIQYILDNGASVGQRNITIACLASFYKSYGKSLNEATTLISEWNSNNASPSPEVELKRTVQSIFSGNKIYGCNTLNYVSKCDNTCKIYQKKQERTNTDKYSKEKEERQKQLKQLGVI